jgi:outer membrane protein assembly factor BamD (BamD/ComL family)
METSISNSLKNYEQDEICNAIKNYSEILNDEKYSKIYSPIYLMTKYVNSRINHYEAAFKHTSGFYICLNRKGESEVFTLKVVYKIKQYEELKIFINNLKKIK